MNQSILIAISAAVLIGVVCIILFNVGWYRRQKRRQAESSNNVLAQVGQTQTEPASNVVEAPTEVKLSSTDSLTHQIGPNTKSNATIPSVAMTHDWWFTGSNQLSQLDSSAIEALKKYDKDPHVLGWIAWNGQVLCANRQYDEPFCNVISTYITAVEQLQVELHMKQFEHAAISSTEGRLLLQRVGSIWVALVVEHA